MTTLTNNNNLKNSTLILTIGNALVFFLFLFMPSLNRFWALLLFAVNILYVFLNKKITIKMSNTNLLWSLFILINMFGMFRNESNTIDAFQFVFSVTLFFLNYVLLVSDNEWIKPMVKFLFMVSLFFMGGSILQIFFPDVVLNFNRLHLSDTLFSQSYVFYRNGALNGFTYQTALNGYIISIFMAIIFSLLSIEKNTRKKIFYGLLYIFSLYLLFLTQKRGFIVFNFIIAIFLFFKLSKYKFKSLIPIIFFGGIFFLVLINTEAGNDMILRTFEQDDLTTGRGSTAMVMWNDFLEQPILGNGTYSTMNAVDSYNGHNIYLQVLRESGIVGFSPFLLMITLNFWKTNSLLNILNDVESKFYLSVSMYIQLLFLLWGLTGNPLYDNYPLILYFVSIAITEVYKNNKDKDLVKI